MANAAQRKARNDKRVAKAASPSTTEEVVTAIETVQSAPAPEATVNTGEPRPNAKSIRALITGMITEGAATPLIAVEVQRQFPNSAAASKSSKHIAYYRSLMKRQKPAAIVAE